MIKTDRGPMSQTHLDLQFVITSFGRSHLLNSNIIYASESETKAIERLALDPENNKIGIDWNDVKSRLKPALKWQKE